MPAADARRAVLADAVGMSTQTITRVASAATNVAWIWVESAIALTLCLVVVGGFVVLEGTAVRIVLAVMLVGVAAHLWLLHRNSEESAHDPTLRRQRERRGF